MLRTAPRSPLRAGDIVEIQVSSGSYAYAQHMGAGYDTDLARVFPGLHTEQADPLWLTTLSSAEPLFTIQYSLSQLVACAAGRVVLNIDVAVPDGKKPPLRVFVQPSERNPSGWFILDSDGGNKSGKQYSELHPEIDQSELAVSLIPNTRLFLRMIENQWRSKQALDRSLGMEPRSQSDTSDDRDGAIAQTRCFCFFDERGDALRAQAGLLAKGVRSTVTLELGDDDKWAMTVTYDGPPDAEVEQWVEGEVESCRGVYEGNEYGPL